MMRFVLPCDRLPWEPARAESAGGILTTITGGRHAAQKQDGARTLVADQEQERVVRPKDDVGHAAATTGWAGRRLEEAGRGRGRFRPSFGHVHERLMDDPGDVQLLGGADAGEIRAGLEGPPVGRLASARAEVIAMSLRLLAVQPRTAGKKRVSLSFRRAGASRRLDSQCET